MKIINLKIGLLIGLFVYLFIGSIPAQAGALSLSLDPPLIEINALPPSIATSVLSIQNKSETEVTLQIQLKPFRNKLENGELEYLDSQEPFIAKNVQIIDSGVPVEGITLSPGQEKKLTLNINIPQDTSLLDYYFSIIFISQTTGTVSSSTTSLNQLGIATNVLLSIGKKEMPDAVLEEFSSAVFYESGPVPFTIRIKNKGMHYIKPKGTILIKNMFGQTIGKLDLTSVNILTNSIRAIPSTTYMQELKTQGNSKIKPKSDLNFKDPKALWKEDFLLGFYTATLDISVSDQGPNFSKSIRFFAFPFQGLIIIVIILIGIIVVAGRVKARMSRRDAFGKK